MAKTTQKPPLAVYDANGRLIGLVDQDKLQPVQTASQSRSAAAPRSSTGVNQPPQSEVDRHAADVVDTMEKALAGIKPKPTHLRKSVGVAPATAGWATLIKELDPTHANRIKRAVSASALKLMLAGVPSTRAVTVCKSAAVRVASRKGVV